MAEFDLFWMVVSHRCLSWLLYKWLLDIFYILQLTVLSIVNSEYNQHEYMFLKLYSRGFTMGHYQYPGYKPS